MIQWFKSSYSGGDNNCVEAAHLPTNFRRSSYSSSHGEYVKLADRAAEAAIRDTKNRKLGALFFDAGEWQAFLGTAHRDMR